MFSWLFRKKERPNILRRKVKFHTSSILQKSSNYIDLAGKDGVFATIDYGTDPPFLFYGKQVSLADIGLADKKSAERAAPESRC